MDDKQNELNIYECFCDIDVYHRINSNYKWKFQENIPTCQLSVNMEDISFLFPTSGNRLLFYGYHLSSINKTSKPNELILIFTLSSTLSYSFYLKNLICGWDFVLYLQQTYPLISWYHEDVLQFHPNVVKNRKETSTLEFYGDLNDDSAWKEQFYVQHSRECQLAGLSNVYQVFPLQQMALDFIQQFQAESSKNNWIDEQDQDILLFCFENEQKGKRQFLVADFQTFWKKYSQMNCYHRHVYEIIRENIPCRMYFDIEYDIQANPTIDGPLLLKHFLHFISFIFYYVYGLSLSLDCFMDLDSSSNHKFSHHIIIHLPHGYLFKNNQILGQFIQLIIQWLKEHPMDEKIFLVWDNKNQEKQKYFFDTCVYSRNRAFRVLGSCKYRKKSILSLILNHSSSSSSSLSFQQQFLSTLVCPLRTKYSSIVLLSFPSSSSFSFSSSSFSSTSSSSSSSRSYGVSPFPHLDQFILSYATNGEISSYSYDPQRNLITYFMKTNRYCENIKRFHKSNNIYFIVNLNTNTFVQKCFDPDCSFFTSASHPIIHSFIK